MKKEWIKIIVALVVLFGIAIPLSLYRGKKMKAEIAKDEAQKFITFDSKKIDRIQLINKDGVQVELEKRTKDAGGKYQDEFENRTFEFKTPPLWIVTQPYRALADDAKIDALTSQLEILSYQKVIQDTQDKKADYSLDHPNLTVRFFESKQSEPKLTLYVGGENPAMTGNYFSASDKPGIYLGDRTLQTYVEQDVDQWKDRKIIDTPDLANVVSVAIHHDNSTDSFVANRDKGNWSIVHGSKSIQADRGLLNEFVDHLNAMRFMKSFEDASVVKSLKKIVTIDWKLRDHNLIQFSLFDGGKDKTIYYLQRSDLPQVFQIAAPDPKLLYTFQKVIDKHLLSKPIDEVTSIKVTTESGKVTEMHREEQNWKMDKPVVDDGSPKRVESFSQTLRDFEGVAYLPNKTLNPKDQKLKIEYGFKDKKTYTITFFEGGKSFYASIDDGTTIRNLGLAQIPHELYDHLSHFRSDELISIPTDHLKGISISKGGARIDVQKNLNTEVWSVLSIENVPSTVNMKWREQMTAQELFNRISDLFVTKFMPAKDPSDSYNDIALTITADDGKAVHWNFGKKQGEMVNLFSPERNIAGQIPWIKYNELSEFLSAPQKTAK